MHSVGFTAGSFDLGPHAGHIAMLKEAKTLCGHLIVGLQVNPQCDRPYKNKPILSLSERFIALSANKYVDEVIPYESESELYELIKLIKPDVRFLGGDYVNRDFTGKDIPGIAIHYCSRIHSLSSSELRKRLGR